MDLHYLHQYVTYISMTIANDKTKKSFFTYKRVIQSLKT